ncbi:Cullin-domain-containing protein [Aureobasidium pullulans]|uniref:Cullin-domain-containing protein n=1 Tax=Aureobasidium pullulans TaxID=5580 RepID=A0A4T0E028_AURPU|nr:Cullin-domain-containing protein [Aureobasidium pullulans]
MLPDDQNQSPALPRILIVGAGSRGNAYARAVSESGQGIVAAIAEPIAFKRNLLGSKYIWGSKNSPSDGQEFEDWRAFLQWETNRRTDAAAGRQVQPGIDGIFVCILDEQHAEVITALGHLAIHTLCEKPLATTLKDCLAISSAMSSQQGGQSAIFGIGHVLRYSPHNMLLRKLVLEDQIIGPLANKKHSADSCKQTITAVARTCITVFHGLKRMESLNSNDGFPSHVVHACVCFFGILFTSIENAARLQVESKQPDRGTAVLQALSTLANSLINILRGSSPNCPSHAEILEGATYDLLHRLGETTHELLMDGPQHDDIEHEVQKLPLPDDKRLDPVRQTAMRTMLTAAPFLLVCLRKALIGAQDQPLAAFARLKLQRTLVDRIFGPGTRGSNASEDVLGLPEVFGEPPMAANPIKKEDIQTKTDQFEEEIWALVGWDILACEDKLHCFDTYNKLFEMFCSHDLALDVFFINLESAGSGCKVVEQQSHDEKVLQRGHSCTPASMPPSISSLPAGDRSPSSSPPHPPARKRKRPSAATTAAATPSASSQPPASLGRQQSIQNLFADQASAAASPSTAIDSSPNRKKVKNQPFNMQSDMYSFSSKVIGGNLPAATSTARRTPGRLNKGFTPKAGTTKLVVKTLKPQPAWDGNKYFEDTWAQLDRALNVIFTQAPVDFSMEELYRGVENLCRQKRAEEIYVKLSSKCKAHVRGPMKTSLLSKQRQSNVQVLDDVLGAWTAWSKQMTVIRCIFYYMDRSYLLQTSRGSLQDVTIKIFRDNIFEDPSLKLAIIDGACDLISADRAGQELEPSHLSQAITMFHDLATYSTSFEPRMLASAQRYVVEWANEKSAEKPLPEYVNEAVTFMTKEIERCELFVGLDSWAIGTDHHSSSPSSPRLTLPEFALASRFTPHRAKPLIHNLTVDTGQELCRHPPTLHHCQVVRAIDN